jgi:hypothetical protein
MAKRHVQETRPLRRKIEFRKPKKTLLIYCEGQCTEPEYLNALRKLPEVHKLAQVDLQIQSSHGGSVPLTLVKIAIDARLRVKDEGGEVDEFWCVFDVESPINHPNLIEAVRLAKQHRINLAISNPCFELWLILHFCNYSAPLNTKDAIRRRRGCDGEKGKSIDATIYMPRRLSAASRAASLAKRHTSGGTFFPNDNPSSGMFRLLKSIE